MPDDSRTPIYLDSTPDVELANPEDSMSVRFSARADMSFEIKPTDRKISLKVSSIEFDLNKIAGMLSKK